MKAYKGFDKDLKCRGYQYEIGKTYEEPKAELCKSGFHACKVPLDVLEYYSPANSRYCEVDLDGVSDEQSDDSKVAGSKIKIGAEIGIPGLVKAHVEWVKSNITNEHNGGKAATAGDCGAATAGYYGAATSRGRSEVGRNGIACVRGNDIKVKGGIGAILVIGIENLDNHNIKEWKAVVVDGEAIKADTWYTLVGGEMVEIESE